MSTNENFIGILRKEIKTDPTVLTENEKKVLVIDLFNIKAVKFGEFTLKSGLVSPIYLDLREIIGHPKLMNRITDAMFTKMSKNVDQICGVPYTALPIASCICTKYNIPMVIKRKEAKDYGTKKLIEGVFEKDMICCVIEDVITSGLSVIETVTELKNVGLQVKEAIILVDRCQSGRENLNKFGINVKSLLTIHEILAILLDSNKITKIQYQMCKEFIEGCQVIISVPKKINEINWTDRLEKSENKITKKLFELINRKKTNLCVAADVETMSELINLAKKIAPYICILKIHSDIIHDFSLESIMELKEISKNENFLIMEDRKFADIGNTVKLQLKNTHYNYLSWCDIITVHGIPGDGIFEGIKSAVKECKAEIGCFIVAEMSSKGALTNFDYKNNCGEMALRHKDVVVGFISQSPVKDDMPDFIHCTPGVKLENGNDALGQNYRSVSDLKNLGFVDVFIVGRGITEAEYPEKAVSLYQQATFTK